MLNKRPIFINAIARGGSNILMNLLVSHPEVCLSSGETTKVFKGTRWDPSWRKIKKILCYDFPIRIATGQNYFSPTLLEERRPVSDRLKKYIDRILYFGRFTCMIETHNLYKFEDIKYTREELAKCRLLTKGNGGIVYTVELFNQMYPDAVFFGLIRHGLANCEGYVRRGGSAEEFAILYKACINKMLEYNTRMQNYYLVRYEDMVLRPLQVTRKIYKFAGLDVGQLEKIRLQSKKVIDHSGRHVLMKGRDRQVFWYGVDELRRHIKPNINARQIQQLKEGDKLKFLRIAGETMERLNAAEQLFISR